MQGSCIELAFHMYSAVFGAAMLEWKGVAFSLHSTCILLYSEVPSMHSDFLAMSAGLCCLWISEQVQPDRLPTEGPPFHRPAGPSWPRGTTVLVAVALPRVCHLEFDQSMFVHGLHTCCHCVGSWHAQTPCVTTFVLKWPSSGQAAMAQAKFN